VNNTVVRRLAGLELESETDPSVALVGTIVVEYLHRIGEGEELRALDALRKAFGKKFILLVEVDWSLSSHT